MAEWIEFSETYVLGAMPLDVATAYGAWLTAHPAKAGQLGEMVGQVLADFQTGLSANPDVQMELRCVPHALSTAVYAADVWKWQKSAPATSSGSQLADPLNAWRRGGMVCGMLIFCVGCEGKF
jgi:hypothetical protein